MILTVFGTKSPIHFFVCLMGFQFRKIKRGWATPELPFHDEDHNRRPHDEWLHVQAYRAPATFHSCTPSIHTLKKRPHKAAMVIDGFGEVIVSGRSWVSNPMMP